jgi:hypothetical protein
MNNLYPCKKWCKNTNSNYMCIDCLKNDVENNCWNYDKCKYFLTYGNLECFTPFYISNADFCDIKIYILKHIK